MTAHIGTPGLTFEETLHRYFFEGRELPSVTAVLADNRLGADFSRVAPDTLEQARRLGSAVHVALHYDDEGTLDATTIDPLVAPYLEAWRRFRTERRVAIVAMERRYADPVYGFAGTLDRIALADGRRVLLDVKTGGVEGAHYQTAAYLHLAGEPAGTRRWAVQLHPERAVPYTVHPHAQPTDWRIFRAALELTHERARNGRSWRQEAA